MPFTWTTIVRATAPVALAPLLEARTNLDSVHDNPACIAQDSAYLGTYNGPVNATQNATVYATQNATVNSTKHSTVDSLANSGVNSSDNHVVCTLAYYTDESAVDTDYFAST